MGEPRKPARVKVADEPIPYLYRGVAAGGIACGDHLVVVNPRAGLSSRKGARSERARGVVVHVHHDAFVAKSRKEKSKAGTVRRRRGHPTKRKREEGEREARVPGSAHSERGEEGDGEDGRLAQRGRVGGVGGGV